MWYQNPRCILEQHLNCAKKAWIWNIWAKFRAMGSTQWFYEALRLKFNKEWEYIWIADNNRRPLKKNK